MLFKQQLNLQGYLSQLIIKQRNIYNMSKKFKYKDCGCGGNCNCKSVTRGI